MSYDSDNIEESVHSLFEIKCKKCGNTPAHIYFSAGNISDSGGDTGYLSIECNNCLSKVELF